MKGHARSEVLANIKMRGKKTKFICPCCSDVRNLKKESLLKNKNEIQKALTEAEMSV